MITNELLREHATSTAFSLNLSKRQMDLLILLHHFRGNFSKAHDYTWGAKERNEHTAARPLNPIWVSNSRALVARGLLSPQVGNWSLTKAGSLVIGLLKEAGIYDERLVDLGIVKAAA